jgi:hypothetical protein
MILMLVEVERWVPIKRGGTRQGLNGDVWEERGQDAVFRTSV